YRAGNYEQVVPSDRASEWYLPTNVVDRVLTAYRTVACQIVIGREHPTNTGNAETVSVQRLESFLNPVSQILTVVISVQLDELNSTFIQPRGRSCKILAAKAPVTPGEGKTRLESSRGALLKIQKPIPDCLVFCLKVL